MPKVQKEPIKRRCFFVKLNMIQDKRLYEDMVAGRINEHNINLMPEKTQKEQE